MAGGPFTSRFSGASGGTDPNAQYMGTVTAYNEANKEVFVRVGYLGSSMRIKNITGPPGITGPLMVGDTVVVAFLNGHINEPVVLARINSSAATPSVAVEGTITARASAGQDGVALAGRAGGSSSYEVTLTPTTLTADRTLTLPNVSGTVITTGNLSAITATGTLTSLTLSGTVTLPNSSNNQIYTSTTANTALPWSDGPVLQGQTGWSFYSAVNSSYRMGFRNNVAGTTRYMWSADSALIGSQPSDAEVTSTLNVLGTGRFTGTVTAPTFSGGLAASNITGQTGMWASAGRPGPTRLYRNDNDDAYNVQTYWTGTRWRLYGYLNNAAHADTHVGYADSSGTSSNVYGSSAALVGYMNISGSGIGYNGATIGGGSPNLIGFRWTNPSVNCTVDNVISAEAANFSDRRLKTNITPYDKGLLAIRSLRPVTFNPLDIISFTDEGEPVIGDNDPYDEMLGFVADEVQEVIPSAVSGTGNQLKSISTLQILSAAVAAIKELDATVASLVERIEKLEPTKT